MSKQTSTNPTEPNKPGLPNAPERGTGDSTDGVGEPAGTGILGVPPEAVLEGEANAPPQAPSNKKMTKAAPPKAGLAWYRVKGPGSVKVNSQWYPPGAELQITRSEALSVDEYLEEIQPPGQ